MTAGVADIGQGVKFDAQGHHERSVAGHRTKRGRETRGVFLDGKAVRGENATTGGGAFELLITKLRVRVNEVGELE